MSRAQAASVTQPSYMELPEPFTVEQYAEHIALVHGFALCSWEGINFRAVHRFKHRDHRIQIGTPHSHLENQGKRGWLPRSFSPNGVKA